MKRPKVGELYSFRMAETDFSGLVMGVRRDPDCLPYGVIIELFSEKNPDENAQYWLEHDGDKLGGGVEGIMKMGNGYKYRLVTIVPDKNFWT